MGCANQNCQRSHAGLKGKVEDLDPHVQMQLLRRGGLRRMRPETKQTAAEKIKKLRAPVAKDKSDKIADGRKSGNAANEAQDLVERATALAQGPVLGRLSNVSDDLYAWAAAKVARNPNAGLEEILGHGRGGFGGLGGRLGSKGRLQWHAAGEGHGVER